MFPFQLRRSNWSFAVNKEARRLAKDEKEYIKHYSKMMKISAFTALALLWVLGSAYAAGYSMGGGGYSGGFGSSFGGINGLYGGGYGGNSFSRKGYGSGTSSVLLLPVASGKGIGGIGGGFGGGVGGFGSGGGFGGGGGFDGILSFIFPLIILIIILPLITNIIPGTG